jgi:DNA-binding GntR family transcriptional regulator
VVTRPRRGSFVASLSANDVEELYTLRSAMELLAVERAATRVTAQDIAEMEKALTELGRALTADDARRTGEADIRFHRAIVRAADHRRLHEAWEVYADQTLLLMQELSHSHPEVQAPSGWHGKILRALAERDSATAVQLLREHLAAAYQGMLEQFSEAGRISP